MKYKNGVIAEIYRDKDYELAGGLTIDKIPKAKYTFWDKQIQYHQPDVSEMSCTLFGCLTAFSNLTGYVFDIKEQLALWGQALKLGASDKAGWYLYTAVDLVRDYVNTLKLGEFSTFRVAVGYDDFYNVLKCGYMVITGYNGNSKWNTDKSDGVLNNTEFGASTYSHIINFADKSPESKNELCIVDSYLKTSPANVYEIPDIIPLYQNNSIFKYGYVFATQEMKRVINQKLTLRFENRMIYNADENKFAVIKKGRKVMFNKMYDLLTVAKWADTNESYACGVTLKDWEEIGN